MPVHCRFGGMDAPNAIVHAVILVIAALGILVSLAGHRFLVGVAENEPADVVRPGRKLRLIRAPSARDRGRRGVHAARRNGPR